MKTIKHVFVAACAFAGLHLSAIAQSNVVTPAAGYSATDILTSTSIFGDAFSTDGSALVAPFLDSNFNLGGLNVYNVGTQQLVTNIAVSSDSYFSSSFLSFVTLSPDGADAFVGFTVGGNTDDRIYRVDLSTKSWTQVATLKGNNDLKFYNGVAYAIGLDGTQGNSLFKLDLSGNTQPDALLTLGGNSAGFDFDSAGNLYYASNTYPATGQAELLRFTAAQLALGVGAGSVSLSTGQVLSNLAADSSGAYTLTVDQSGVYFNQNAPAGDSATIAKWNGTVGSGQNFSLVATSPGFLTGLDVDGGVLYATGFAGGGVAKIQAVPEPSSIAFLAFGGGVAAVLLHRRRAGNGI